MEESKMTELYLEFSVIDTLTNAVVSTGHSSKLEAYIWIGREGGFNKEYIIQETVIKKNY